ncbi:MAG TPA: DUF4340 domain-containing protein [Planctomycetes bacterium]|nr:DUF4340 domain-containing protein [Planctomycetota bacterium]
MNENVKTLTFVGVAIAISLVAWLSQPSLPEVSIDQMQGKTLFPEFDDPLKAASLEILEFDEETATVRPFKVAQIDEQWSIPSHENYPADAEEQLAEVATGLMGLKVLEVASDSPGDHELFGVLDPDPKKRKVGDTGVGRRVTIRDKKDNVLLDLIVGKEVPEREGLRYVRVAGKDPVYTVALNTDKISTRFEDWIEEDLLKLNTWDVRHVRIHDYSVDLLAGRQIPRSLMALEYDDSESKWELVECKVFKEDRYQDVGLADDEELDTTKLNDMKWALDDLKIVDVARKPKGLSATLRQTGQVRIDPQARDSLANRGFYIVPVGDHYELLSSEGEIVVTMKDGVEYVLRFGQIAGGSEASSEGEEQPSDEQKDKPEEEQDDSEESEGLNRYLFVMAQFNPDIIPKPELEPLPEAKKEEKTESGNGEAEPAGSGEQEGRTQQPAEGSEKTAEDAASDPAEKETAPDEEPEAQAQKGQEHQDEGQQQEEAAEDKEKEHRTSDQEESDLEKERQRIKEENERKQKEYEEKIEAGKKRVKELNERFADWYYIISDEVYRKIHLSRDDVVKKKESTEEEGEAEQPETPEMTGQEETEAETEGAEQKGAEPEASPPGTEGPAAAQGTTGQEETASQDEAADAQTAQPPKSDQPQAADQPEGGQIEKPAADTGERSAAADAPDG